MGEIINWLRGGEIFIITLVRRNNQENPLHGPTVFFPESLLDSPDFTQWVVKTIDEAQTALNQIISEVANQIKVAQENEHGIDVNSNKLHAEVNKELTKNIPDCAMIVDLIGLGNTDKSNPSKEDYNSLYYRFYVTAFKLTNRGWE